MVVRISDIRLPQPEFFLLRGFCTRAEPECAQNFIFFDDLTLKGSNYALPEADTVYQAVRESELAESSRAAAVARAQQLLTQATMIDDSSAGLLLLPGAVASAGGPQQGVSGVV